MTRFTRGVKPKRAGELTEEITKMLSTRTPIKFIEDEGFDDIDIPNFDRLSAKEQADIRAKLAGFTESP